MMTYVENTRLDNIEKKLEDFEGKLDKIYTALIGNELSLDKGLIAEFKSIKERFARIEAAWTKAVWISLGAGTAAGLIITKLWAFLQELILKK